LVLSRLQAVVGVGGLLLGLGAMLIASARISGFARWAALGSVLAGLAASIYLLGTILEAWPRGPIPRSGRFGPDVAWSLARYAPWLGLAVGIVLILAAKHRAGRRAVVT